MPKNESETNDENDENITKKSPTADAFLSEKPRKLTSIGVINIDPPTPSIPENIHIQKPIADSDKIGRAHV